MRLQKRCFTLVISLFLAAALLIQGQPSLAAELSEQTPVETEEVQEEPAGEPEEEEPEEEKQAVEVKVHVRTKKANSNIWNKLPEGNVTEVVEHFLPEAEQLCPNCVQKWKSLAKKSTRLW